VNTVISAPSSPSHWTTMIIRTFSSTI
jgi:hypothetical protein